MGNNHSQRSDLEVKELIGNFASGEEKRKGRVLGNIRASKPSRKYSNVITVQCFQTHASAQHRKTGKRLVGNNTGTCVGVCMYVHTAQCAKTHS